MPRYRAPLVHRSTAYPMRSTLVASPLRTAPGTKEATHGIVDASYPRPMAPGERLALWVGHLQPYASSYPLFATAAHTLLRSLLPQLLRPRPVCGLHHGCRGHCVPRGPTPVPGRVALLAISGPAWRFRPTGYHSQGTICPAWRGPNAASGRLGASFGHQESHRPMTSAQAQGRGGIGDCSGDTAIQRVQSLPSSALHLVAYRASSHASRRGDHGGPFCSSRSSPPCDGPWNARTTSGQLRPLV